MKKSFALSLALTSVLIVSLACEVGRQVIEDQNADEPSIIEPPSSSGAATTEPEVDKSCAEAPPQDYSGPAPQAGAGNLYGHLMWNNSPLSNHGIQICTDANYKNECESTVFSATTDSSGAFVITNIPPGEYNVLVHAVEQEKWLDARELIEFFSTVEIKSDKCITTSNIHVIKYDLFQKSPGNNVKISEARPVLSWDAYPDAAYYEVYWGGEEGLGIYLDERTDTNQIAPQADVPTCRYSWKVTAFNSQSIAIAETEEFSSFYVTNQPLSCYVVNNVPVSNSTISGENLILSWDAHPLADHYQISMVMSSPTYTKILDYVEVTEPRYALDVKLEPGDYYWNIYAIDQFGDTVAGDEGNTYFTVK